MSSNGSGERPYVRRVESNAKMNVAVDLSQHTLIVGETGSGKSAVVNAVELALTGRASDLVGRSEVADGSALMALAPGRTGRLWARVVLSDGRVSQWEIPEGKTRGSLSVQDASGLTLPTLSENVLPLRAIREAVAGSADTMRKFFLSKAAGTATDAAVLERIPALLQPHYKQALIGVTGTPLDKLVAVLETAKAKASEKKRDAEAAEALARGTADGQAAPPTDDTYREAQGAVARARSILEATVAATERARAAVQARAQLAPTRTALETARARELEAADLLAKWDGYLSSLPAPPADSDTMEKQTYRAAVRFLAQAEESWRQAGHATGSCVVCRQPTPLGTFHRHDQEIQARAAERAKLFEAHTAATNTRAQAAAAHDQARAEVRRLAAQLAAMEHALASVESTGTGTPMALTDARAVLDKAEGNVRALDAIKVSWQHVRRARDQAAGTKIDSDSWKQLQTACAQVVKDLLDAGVGGFVARVQTHLPPTDAFGLRLRDGRREVCQFGLWRGPAGWNTTADALDAVLHTALSGHEWARVTVAMAAACAAEAPSDPVILIPEDRGISPNALAVLLFSLSSSPFQVIVTSPVRPVNLPAGWTVIDTDAWEHRGVWTPRNAAAERAAVSGA